MQDNIKNIGAIEKTHGIGENDLIALDAIGGRLGVKSMKWFSRIFVATVLTLDFGSFALAQGTFFLRTKSNFVSLFPITLIEGETSEFVTRFLYESLLDVDVDTYAWKPSIAEKWEVSKDGKEFTYWINPKAKFWDGTSVTAEDVKFSFDIINMPGVDSATLKPYVSEIEKVDILGPNQVRFKTKSLYFKNFEVASNLLVLQKKYYMDLYNKEKSMSKGDVTRKVMATGPWQVETWDENQRLILKRNESYWNKQQLIKEGMWTFDKRYMKIMADDSVSIEALKKGEISFMRLTPKQWQLQTKGPEFSTKVTKVRAENRQPSNYGFIGWNLQHPILGNKDVRWALSHIANLPLWSQKFDFGLVEPAISPFGPKSDYHDPSLKPVRFDLNLARKRLAQAGWTKAASDGVLVKEGRRFEITILYPIAARESYEPKLTEYKNQAAKVGVSILLKGMEWSSFLKLLDERKFDAVSLAWGRIVEQDLKQIWHSQSADNKGDNFINYRNPELDRLIDQFRATIDRGERAKIGHQMSRMIYEDQPYTFLTQSKASLYAVQKNITRPKDTFVYDIGTMYWKMPK